MTGATIEHAGEDDPEQAVGIDRYTAPAQDVPSRGGTVSLAIASGRSGASPRLRICSARSCCCSACGIAQGAWSWRDAVMLAGLIAVTPFVEWAIHVYVLHSPALRLRGRRIEIPSAREHRAHHEAPAVLGGVLLPVYGVLVFLPMIALVNWVLSFPIAFVLGGPRLAYATTGVLVSFAILTSYEWTHFLIHTPYRARHRYFKAIWRNHRLHHFKNERYWFGVTSTVGDRVIGTLPDQRSVARSPTARSLRTER